MDKASRALSLAEDHALEMESLKRRMTERVKAVSLDGRSSGGKTVFGNVTAYGGGAVVVFDGEKCDLVFNGEVVASGGSPMLCAFVGTGELALSAQRANARALIMCAKS